MDIRAPPQRRSREAWIRVLDTGVALLEEGGYEAITIAAVCKRAQVAPHPVCQRARRALQSRTRRRLPRSAMGGLQCCLLHARPPCCLRRGIRFPCRRRGDLPRDAWRDGASLPVPP